MALRDLNVQFIREEGPNRALLEERKEPPNNSDCAAMLAVPNGTASRGYTANAGPALKWSRSKQAY